MSAPATPPSPPATVVSEGDRAYVGYRRRGAATVRLPSGVYVTVPSSSDRELAAAALADRLGAAATAPLVDRFGRDRLCRRTHGEFVWPVAAHAIARHLFAAPLQRVCLTPSPRGAH